ncbi:Ig-like domain repeat protein [Angustibacter luteus]|uniref:Ig-like domain repeat protein n=1 Tax=Angustibacter luteus TaxID=658456 RepID=A0ABW1JDC1_9ACTN
MLGAVTMALVAGAVMAGSATPATASTSYAPVDTIHFAHPLNDSLVVDPAHQSVYLVDGSSNQVTVVDTSTGTVKATIPVGDSPQRIALDPVLDRAYVTNYGVDGFLGEGVDGSSVSVIDTSTNTVVDTIPGLSNPRGLAVDPTTHLVYVVNYWSQVMSVIDPAQSPATIAETGYLESRPWAVDVDPTTHRAYATTLYGGSLSTISGTATLDTLYGFGGPTQVTVDPETQRAYVANSGNISVVDISNDAAAITGTLAAGTQPSDVAIDPAAGLFYVTNYGDNTVSVIDKTSNAILATVPVGDHPTAVEVDRITHRAYVVNSDNTLSVIAPFASQDITFTSVPPTNATVGGSAVVTATGGGSGNTVTFSTTSPACTVSTGGQVDFNHAGQCVIAADQAGSSTYTAAPTATQDLAVALNATATTLSLPTGGVVFGQAATATVAVSGTHDGSVQFTLDGAPVGSPLALAADGTATSSNLVGSGLAVGSHPVGAVFTPTDSDTYAASSATPQALTVGKAATTSSVSIDPNAITATVTPTVPGAGDPTGNVDFYLAGTKIGSASLTSGTATLAHRVPNGADRAVSTIYAGDTSFTGSSASTARRDPVITAAVSSTKASRHGWYATSVTVTFTCHQTSAALTATCPAPVTLSRNAAGQSVTRTIIAADGGAATAVVTGINIDSVRPTARVTGVRAGATYFATGPVAGCRAADSLSGVTACTVTRTTRGHQVTYVATATDRAGNRSSTRLVARTTSVAISGASMSDGRYVVHRGRTYTVLVAAANRPTFIYATPSPGRPAGGGLLFKRIGKNRWALGVTFTQSMSNHAYWNIGTRVGSHTTVTTVHVVR